VAGRRAVRVDILERLADIIRPLIALDASRHEGELPPGAAEGNGFRVTVEMTSLLGTAGEDFASILTALGYRVRRTPKPATPVAAETAPPEAAMSDAGDAAAPAATAEAGVEAPRPYAAAEAAPPDTAEEAAEAADQAAEAAVNVEAQDAVEGTTPGPEAQVAEAQEVEAVATATADLGAPPPEAGTQPAEPEYDEIWFPGGRRDNARHEGKRQGRPRRGNGAAEAEGAQPAERQGRRPGPRIDGEERQRPAGKGRPRHEGRRPEGEERKPRFAGSQGADRHQPRPPREKREPVYDPDSPFAALAALRQPKPE